MTFPQTVLPLKLELFVNNAWTDVSSKVYQRNAISIMRGLRSEGSTADVSTCAWTFNNRSGNFYPYNPNGAYFGTIGRNTPMRLSLPPITPYMPLFYSTTLSQQATAPDNARIDITGDIDLRYDAWMGSWQPYAQLDLIGKYTTTANQRSYSLTLESRGFLQLRWSTDGTLANTIIVNSTAVVPGPITGRRAVRATLQVNNGAGGYTVTFYTASTISSSWTQLGDQIVTTGGVTSIFNGTSSLFIGDIPSALGLPPTARVYAAQVLNGIGGTAGANPDFTAQTDGATSFTDAAGNTWTLSNTAINGRFYKFFGEISEWPPSRDKTDRDRTVSVTASGIFRRLGKGTKALKSVYYRGCTSAVAPVTGLVAYWPCEDLSGATYIASGIAGNANMVISGTPTLASDSTSFACSSALPNMNTGSFTGQVSGTPTGSAQYRILLNIPAGGLPANTIIASFRTFGAAARWEIVATNSTTLTVNAYDPVGTNILTSVAGPWTYTGVPLRLGFSIANSGANINWALTTLGLNALSGTVISGTLNGYNFFNPSQVSIAPNKDCSGMTAGQITVQNVITSIYDLSDLLNAYVGETATNRIVRLCSEEGIQVGVYGQTLFDLQAGAQSQKTLLDLLHECESIDGGILYESRNFFGLEYRSVHSMMSQNAVATLSYSNADLSDPFAPTVDDRYVTNDYTATRQNGSSSRYVLTSGSLSTQAPPNGVGTYDSSVTLNNYADQDLHNIASWHVHLGTVDQPRFPQIVMELNRAPYTSNSTKNTAVQVMDIGDRLVIQNPPSDLPPEDLTQIVIGINETLNQFIYTINVIGQPETPFHVMSWSDGVSRYSPYGATLAASATAVATTISVASPEVVFGFADGAYDIMIGGERMTVTAVTGTTSPQTLTVTRAVNGISKAHNSGDAVTLFDTRYWSI